MALSWVLSWALSWAYSWAHSWARSSHSSALRIAPKAYALSCLVAEVSLAWHMLLPITVHSPISKRPHAEHFTMPATRKGFCSGSEAVNVHILGGLYLGTPADKARTSYPLSGSNATPLVSRYSCRATLCRIFRLGSFRSVARESHYNPFCASNKTLSYSCEGVSHLDFALYRSQDCVAVQGVSQLQCRESRYTAPLSISLPKHFSLSEYGSELRSRSESLRLSAIEGARLSTVPLLTELNG